MRKETIYREDAIKAFRSTVAQYVPFLNGINMTLPLECETALRSVPSADRPRAEWIGKTEGFHSHWCCSSCGAWALLEYDEQMCLSKYCPSCGAIMTNADNALNALDVVEVEQ